MKGIVLAGGTGSRLWPLTKATSKQLLPIYDKPMIYYPLATLMTAGIDQILIITTPTDQLAFKNILGDGSDFGVKLSYAVQPRPEGLAQALIIAEKFIADSSCMMILGDNVFHGLNLLPAITKHADVSGCHIFTSRVEKPEQYGILTVNEGGVPVQIEEKPIFTNSKLAVTGLYIFDNKAPKIAKTIQPSKRGELEITDVLNKYLEHGELQFTQLNVGDVWLDTGNPSALHDAASYVRVIEERTGLKIACLEEIALQNGWINQHELERSVIKFRNSSYGLYLDRLSNDENLSSENSFSKFGMYKYKFPETSFQKPFSNNCVSVIVPIYKPQRNYFNQTLNSIRLQTYKIKDLIFVFDGWYESWVEDDILGIFPHAVIVKNEENFGQGIARNIGAEKAQGEWLAFIDQDDLWMSNHLEVLMSELSKGRFAFGYTDIEEIDQDNLISVESMMTATVKYGKNSLIKKDILDLVFRDLMIFPSSAIINRETFLSIGGFPSRLRGHEDDFLFRKLVQTRTGHLYCNLITASWRKHVDGTSSSILMSDSRLLYAEMLFEEFKDDKLLQRGIFIRFAKSCIREMLATKGDANPLNYPASRLNALKLIKIAKRFNLSVPILYKIVFQIDSQAFLKFCVRIFLKLHRLTVVTK